MTYTGLCRKLARGCMWLAIFGLVGLLAAVTTQVFGRYVLNSTPTWAESLAMLLVGWNRCWCWRLTGCG